MKEINENELKDVTGGIILKSSACNKQVKPACSVTQRFDENTCQCVPVEE